MTGSRPWRDILATIQAALDGDDGITFAAAWMANLATPAVLVVPIRRYTLRPDVRWELALQVVTALQSDDDETLHELTELALAALPAGVITGDTTFGQDDRAGSSYVVSTTTLNA